MILFRLPLALCYAALAMILGSMAMVALVSHVFTATLRGPGAGFVGTLGAVLRRGQ